MRWKRQALVLAMFVAAYARPVAADDAKPLRTAQIEKLHAMLLPQAGESRWMEIDWYPNVWEARQKAAAEGKPIFLMAGSGGAPPAGC